MHIRRTWHLHLPTVSDMDGSGQDQPFVRHSPLHREGVLFGAAVGCITPRFFQTSSRSPFAPSLRGWALSLKVAIPSPLGLLESPILPGAACPAR